MPRPQGIWPAANGNEIQGTLESVRFGSTTGSKAGCESIAIYNVLHGLGRNVSLVDSIYETEAADKMLRSGKLGTKIYKIPGLLDTYGVSYTKTSEAEMQASVKGECIQAYEIVEELPENETSKAPDSNLFGIYCITHWLDCLHKRNRK